MVVDTLFLSFPEFDNLRSFQFCISKSYTIFFTNLAKKWNVLMKKGLQGAKCWMTFNNLYELSGYYCISLGWVAKNNWFPVVHKTSIENLALALENEHFHPKGVTRQFFHRDFGKNRDKMSPNNFPIHRF